MSDRVRGKWRAVVSRYVGYSYDQGILSAVNGYGTVTDDATSGSRVWTRKEDQIWRGASLMANESAVGTPHYALDHLGSPRLVTGSSGTYLGTQEFSAFGEGGTLDGGALQFTGHEGDWSHGPAGWEAGTKETIGPTFFLNLERWRKYGDKLPSCDSYHDSM